MNIEQLNKTHIETITSTLTKYQGEVSIQNVNELEGFLTATMGSRSAKIKNHPDKKPL
jgi:hypothetical protein